MIIAKGSVRKKGKKWYYRFYVEDAAGNLVQREFAGTESKSETEKLLRQAMENYEKQKFTAKTDNITLGKLLDIWSEEELKAGSFSNGTVGTYMRAIARIKQHPIANRKLKSVTTAHLQQLMDLMTYGGKEKDFVCKGYSSNYIRIFSSVLQHAFRFAVFPKQMITFNPMQYVKIRQKQENVDLFSGSENGQEDIPLLSWDDYNKLIEWLKKNKPQAVLPIQIAYYTGLRIGEVCSLMWQDINFEEQYLTVRRSISYNCAMHKNIIGPTKRNKVRTVDFGDTLTAILKKARRQQLEYQMLYGKLYHTCYYKEVHDRNRVYYEYHCLENSVEPPADYKAISFVCLRPNGCLELPATLWSACRTAKKNLEGLEEFHFHQIRHTYTSNLLALGASPKDVQELLGHSNVSTTMNVYAHATKEARKNSARLLDKVGAIG